MFVDGTACFRVSIIDRTWWDFKGRDPGHLVGSSASFESERGAEIIVQTSAPLSKDALWVGGEEPTRCPGSLPLKSHYYQPHTGWAADLSEGHPRGKMRVV